MVKDLTGIYVRVGNKTKDLAELTDTELHNWLSQKDKTYTTSLVRKLLERIEELHDAHRECKEDLEEAYRTIDAMYKDLS